MIAQYKKSKKNEPPNDHRDNEKFYRFMQDKGRHKNSEKFQKKGFFDPRSKPKTKTEVSHEDTEESAYTNQDVLVADDSESQIDKYIESYHNSMPDYYTFESFNSSNTQMQDRSHNINSPINPKHKPDSRKHRNFSKTNIPDVGIPTESQEVDYSVTTPVEDIETEEVDINMNFDWHSQNYTSDDRAAYLQHQTRDEYSGNPLDARRNGLVDKNTEKYYNAVLRKQNSNQRNIIRSSGQRDRGKVLNKIMSEGNFAGNAPVAKKKYFDPYYNNYVDDSAREGQSDAGKALQKIKNDYRKRERSRE